MEMSKRGSVERQSMRLIIVFFSPDFLVGWQSNRNRVVRFRLLSGASYARLAADTMNLWAGRLSAAPCPGR
jgi:hypothetical protein